MRLILLNAPLITAVRNDERYRGPLIRPADYHQPFAVQLNQSSIGIGDPDSTLPLHRRIEQFIDLVLLHPFAVILNFNKGTVVLAGNPDMDRTALISAQDAVSDGILD